MEAKEEIKSWINMIIRLGGGLSLLIMGTIFLIAASKAGARYGDYPEFLNVGIVIMGCGLLSFISEVVKQIFIKRFNTKKEIKMQEELTKRYIAVKGKVDDISNLVSTKKEGKKNNGKSKQKETAISTEKR